MAWENLDIQVLQDMAELQQLYGERPELPLRCALEECARRRERKRDARKRARRYAGSNFARTATCSRCKREFKYRASRAYRPIEYCSELCRAIARREKKREFMRKSRGQKVTPPRDSKRDNVQVTEPTSPSLHNTGQD